VEAVFPRGGGVATFSDELNALAYFPGLGAGASIKALETNGAVEVLAQPNVIAANGKQASFLAGGEYPYPRGPGWLQRFGTHHYTHVQGIRDPPQFHSNDYHAWNDSTPGSHLKSARSISPTLYRCPVFKSRRSAVAKSKTEVELNEGQTFVIGGPASITVRPRHYRRFRSSATFQCSENSFSQCRGRKPNTELIVMVTPELVDPIPRRFAKRRS